MKLKVCEFTIFADRLSFFGGLGELPINVRWSTSQASQKMALSNSSSFSLRKCSKMGLHPLFSDASCFLRSEHASSGQAFSEVSSSRVESAWDPSFDPYPDTLWLC